MAFFFDVMISRYSDPFAHFNCPFGHCLCVIGVEHCFCLAMLTFIYRCLTLMGVIVFPTLIHLARRKQQNFSHIFHRALHPLLSLSSISDLSPSLVLPCEEIILNWLKINHLVYQTSPQTRKPFPQI
ncbi:hypothetical protein Pst134EB_001202 [Puccinia striiformis f. sp. tritici]|nr:hypothetical protein Pst134EB_001202 [Puccinia striiformis f. sp. tritici]